MGKRLRLAQQYFFVSCSLQDMLHLLDIAGKPVEQFARGFAVQLNDTHPSIGVAELMRLLVDERPGDCVAGNAELRAVLELIGSGYFTRGDAEVFRPLVDNVAQSDPFLVLADYAAYVDCQKVSAAWQDADSWARMSILNTACSGKFSSGRAIAEYCDEIWNVNPVTVKL